MVRPWHYGAVAAALALAFLGGRMSAPGPSVEVREKERIVYRDREQTNTKIATVAAPAVRTVYLDRTITVPGGTVTIEKWRDVEHKGEVKTTAEEQTVLIREVDVVRDVVRIETRAPTWGVSLMGGASVAEPWLTLPVASRAVVGVSVERHIVGPFSAGAWASSFGAGGVSLGARW